MNDKNLQRGKESQFNSERAAEAGRKSGEARRKKANMKMTAFNLLNTPIKPGKLIDIDDLDHIEGIDTENMTAAEKIVLVAIKNAMKGDWKAREWLSRVTDDKAIQFIEVHNDPLEGLTFEQLVKLAGLENREP